MSKEPTILSYEQFTDDECPKPSKWWIRSAMGDYYFFHCRERSSAQLQCDKIFGKRRYTVNTSGVSKNRKELSCTGTATRKK